MMPSNSYKLTTLPLTWKQVVDVANGAHLGCDEAIRTKLANARGIVDRVVAKGERAYGITTGLGALCNVALAPDALSKMSHNTIQSHACGIGTPLSRQETRAILCCALQNYAHGHSGISPYVVYRLLDFLNLNIVPVVPSRGSVGYLTHMAHMALPLIGLGELWVEGERVSGATALKHHGFSPITLGAKDGLSLVNGTPCMTGLLCVALDIAFRLVRWADVISAMSFEALRGQLAAFDPMGLALKPYPGVLKVGDNLRRLLAGSQILAESQGIRTQDALSIRSIPQIHGATRDQLDHISRQVDTELRSSTDNPLLFGTPEDYKVISQANPHGQSMAMAADILAIAVAELAGVSERRIDRLVNPTVSGLPPFLLEDSGINSGLMIIQYVAAALVAENKVLVHPMVVDNFVTSALQEDHLSLGTPAALKVLQVMERVETVLAIEYIVASQALHFFAYDRLANGTRTALDQLRALIPPYVEDRVVATDIETAIQILRTVEVLDRVEQAVGSLS